MSIVVWWTLSRNASDFIKILRYVLVGEVRTGKNRNIRGIDCCRS